MDNLKVHVEAEVNPTESEEKVRKAVWNLFGDIPMQVNSAYQGGVLTAEGKGQNALFTLRNVLRRDHIRDAARKALHQGTRGNTVAFCLNKQVAFAGHVSFSEEAGESPLGPIKVTIQTGDPAELIAWLAPKTTKP
jgi:predicted RNA binding protein with dsRBD fold (UPF0201 family)